MAKTINLVNTIKHTAKRPEGTPKGRKGHSLPNARIGKQAGFKKHGHQASKVICNRNMWKAGAGMIWTEV